jgi:signal transduction histidine kinase
MTTPDTALPPVRVLQLEDNADDAELIQRALRKDGMDFVAERVETRDAFVRALRDFRPDIIVADCVLPAFDGRSALRLARQALPDVPVILVTGALVEEVIVKLLEDGARDYVLKDRLARLAPVMRRALREAQESRERQAETRAAVAHSAEVDSANRAMAELLASTSHELRTPLHAILGFAELLLLSRPLTASQEEQIRGIGTAGNHLLSLVGDLMDLAALDAGMGQLRLEEIDCRALMEDVYRTLQPLAQRKGLRFSLIADAPRAAVMASPRALRQIVMNLAGNATKFTDAGSVTLELAARQVDGRATVEIAVADTGIGIKPEHRERLFRPFSRIDRGKREGTGLGLHLSRKLAGLMGGDISFTSEFGKGSRFWLTLPQAAVAAGRAAEEYA